MKDTIETSYNTGLTNKFTTTMSLTAKRIILNFKSFATNPLTAILLFLVPTLFCFSTVVIAPIRYDLGLILTSAIVLMELVTYGTVAGAFRRSTLNKNTNLTVGVRWIDNLATIGTMFIMGVIMVTYVLLLLSIFDVTGILLISFNERSSLYENAFITSISLSIIYYYAVVLTLITYSVSYFFQGFFDSDMMFFTLGLIIFIALMLLGATFNDYFYVSHIDPKTSSTTIKYADWSPYGEWMFGPSLLFPFYVPTQVIKLNGDFIVHPELEKSVVWSFLSSADAYNFGGDIWKWNIMWFVPYFHIFFWWTMGFTYKYFRK